MTTSSSTIVQRLWNDCNVLRDDGMSYDDYNVCSSKIALERITP